MVHVVKADVTGKPLKQARQAKIGGATYQFMPIEKWAEVVAGASAGRPPRNDAGSLYSEADRITGRPGSEFLVQHLREVAIDHTNGIFAGTNEFVEKIGGQPPLTVEAFVAKHSGAF